MCCAALGCTHSAWGALIAAPYGEGDVGWIREVVLHFKSQ